MRRVTTVFAAACLVSIAMLSGIDWADRATALQVDPTITAYETEVAELSGTIAALEVEVANARASGTPIAHPGGDVSPTELLDLLLATPWTDEEFPTGDDAEGEERTAFPDDDQDVADAVGGVGISWTGGPWTLAFIVFETGAEANEFLASSVEGGAADELRVSETSYEGRDGLCVGPQEVVPGSPDFEVCLAVSGNVVVVSVGDDHDASRVAFLLFAGLRHLEVVRGG